MTAKGGRYGHRLTRTVALVDVACFLKITNIRAASPIWEMGQLCTWHYQAQVRVPGSSEDCTCIYGFIQTHIR